MNASPTAPTTSRITPAMWLALAVALVGELFDALDSLITTVAGPSIVADLGGDGTVIQWLAAGYTIAMAAGLLVGGRLGDMAGRRRVFLFGMAAFTAMSLLAACATTPGMLVAARVLQGLLGALMVPQTFGIYRDVFPADRLGQAFALMGPVMAVAGLAGPIVAGAILRLDLLGLGWRALFALNLPFCLLALALGVRVLPPDRPDRSLSLDLGSAALAALGIPAILFALVEGRDLGWPRWVFVLAAAGVVLLGLFVRRQRRRVERGRTPLLEPSLFGNRAFLGGLGFGVLVFGAGTSVGFLVALFGQLGLGMSPLAASLLTVPDMAGMMLGMGLVGRLGSNRRTMAIGTAGLVLGSLVLLGMAVAGGDAITAWSLVPGQFVVGLGSGLVMGPFFDMVITGVSDRETGSASGALSATQQVGVAFGVAVFGSIFFGTAERPGGMPGYAHGLELALGVIAVAMLVGFPVLRLLPARSTDDEPADAVA